jgi:hypothetical protein
MSKEVVAAYFKILSDYQPGGTENIHEKLQSRHWLITEHKAAGAPGQRTESTKYLIYRRLNT